MIYLDNCATTQVKKEAAQKALEMMCTNYGNPSSLHNMGTIALKNLYEARYSLSKVIAAPTNTIYFTSGATESNNLAIQGGCAEMAVEKGHIVTTSIEHSSVLGACRKMEEKGYHITYIQPDSVSHSINANDIISAVNPSTVMVSIMAVNNETGEILPLKEIIDGVKTKNPKTLIHCDATQCFGKLPFKLHEYPVDYLSASGHKIHAPKGIGILYVRTGLMPVPFKYGGAQEGKINPGTESVPLACAFGVATESALESINQKIQYITQLKDYLKKSLNANFSHISFNEPKKTSPYILNFSFQGHDSEKIIDYCSLHDIYLSSSSACAKGRKSHVLKEAGFDEWQINGAVRIGLSIYNTTKDIDHLINVLSDYFKHF